MAKWESITELDMSSISAGKRRQAIDRLMGSTTLYLEQRYPVTQGYRHKRREFKPYQEHPHFVSKELVVQRGKIWGYTVQFRPVDLEYQTVSVKLSTDQRLLGIVMLGVVAPVLLLVAWVLGTGRITIDANTDPTALIAGLVGLAVLWALLIPVLWLPVRALMSLKVDKQAQEQEMDDLRAEIRDLLVATQ